MRLKRCQRESEATSLHRRRRPHVFAAATAFVALTALSPTTDKDPLAVAFEECRSQSTSAEARVRACSVALQSRRLTALAAALALTIRGSILLERGERQASLADFDAAIRQNPDSPIAHQLRALLLFGERQHERELADWNDVIRLAPTSAEALHHRGDTLDSIGRHDEAIADYTASLGLRPSAQVYVDRGIAYTNKRDDERALADFAEALRLEPERVTAYKARGQLEFARGHFATAAGDFDAANRLQPSDYYSALWLYLARTRGGQDASDALAAAARKLNLDKWPGAVVLLFLAQLPAEQVRADPDPVPLQEIGNHCEEHFYKGEYYLIRGDRSRAVAEFRAAADTGVTEFIEYRQARIELKALDH